MVSRLNYIFFKEIKIDGRSSANVKERSIFKEELGEEKFREYEILIPKIESLLKKIVDKLGNNFISETNIHLMNGIWGGPREVREINDKNFKEKTI